MIFGQRYSKHPLNRLSFIMLVGLNHGIGGTMVSLIDKNGIITMTFRHGNVQECINLMTNISNI